MKYFIYLTFALFANFCPNDDTNDRFALFKNTEVWDLAKAVKKQDTSKIAYLINVKGVEKDYQEKKKGYTVLMAAVENELILSVEALLKNGASGNIQNRQGLSSLMLACDFGQNYNTNSDILKLLIQWNGDVNAVQNCLEENGNTVQFTPLQMAAPCCLDKVKLLVEAGANINQKTKYNGTPLRRAADGFKDAPDIVKYLVIEKKAIVDKPLMRNMDGKDLYLVDFLRDWTFPLDSREYQVKQEIIKYLKTQGQDYSKSEIPTQYRKNYSEEYLRQY